jgi:hypothetical protein
MLRMAKAPYLRILQYLQMGRLLFLCQVHDLSTSRQYRK